MLHLPTHVLSSSAHRCSVHTCHRSPAHVSSVICTRVINHLHTCHQSPAHVSSLICTRVINPLNNGGQPLESVFLKALSNMSKLTALMLVLSVSNCWTQMRNRLQPGHGFAKCCSKLIPCFCSSCVILHFKLGQFDYFPFLSCNGVCAHQQGLGLGLGLGQCALVRLGLVL